LAPVHAAKASGMLTLTPADAIEISTRPGKDEE
jgi:hypothetical protein